MARALGAPLVGARGMIEFAAQLRRGDFALDIGFTAPESATTVLFGASGAGKSTVLGLFAGELRPDAGRIVVDGTVLTDTSRAVHLPIEERRVGWVFQEGRLFPHLRVRQNLQYGQRRSRSQDSGAAMRTEAVIDVLGIEPLLERWPRDLSGGERQRVAIGRALLAQPRLLLLDEPLASLDVPRKIEILTLIERLKLDFRLPIVYVTHSLAETLRLADYLVLLEAGRVTRAGPAAQLIGRADTPLLPQRQDAGSLIEAVVATQDPDRSATLARIGDLELQVPYVEAPIGQLLRLYVLANDVLLATERPRGISVRNILPARVMRVMPRDRLAVQVELEIAGRSVLASVSPAAAQDLDLLPGRLVYALIKSVAIDSTAGLRLMEGDQQ